MPDEPTRLSFLPSKDEFIAKAIEEYGGLLKGEPSSESIPSAVINMAMMFYTSMGRLYDWLETRED